MMDDEAFSSEEDVASINSVTVYEDDSQVTTDGGSSLATPIPRYQVFSREISDVYDPTDPANVNTRYILFPLIMLGG